MVMRPDRYTEQAQEVLRTSQALVNEMRHTQWDVEHLVLAMLEQEGGLAPEILEKLGTDTLTGLATKIQAGTEKNTYGRLRRSEYLHNASHFETAGTGSGRDDPTKGRFHWD